MNIYTLQTPEACPLIGIFCMNMQKITSATGCEEARSGVFTCNEIRYVYKRPAAFADFPLKAPLALLHVNNPG
jgi:hypothetical protein